MKTAKVNLYSFTELSADGQKKALQNLADINVNYEWYDFMYDDARRVGVEITSFDLSYRQNITGHFLQDHEEVAANIVREYTGSIQSLAAKYLSDIGNHENDSEALSEQFEKDVLLSYWKDLRDQYEHSTSEAAIKDTIEANEYLFFESGKLIPVSMYPPKRRTIRERVRAAWAHMRAKFAPVHLALFAPAVAALIYAIITND